MSLSVCVKQLVSSFFPSSQHAAGGSLLFGGVVVLSLLSAYRSVCLFVLIVDIHVQDPPLTSGQALFF